MRTPRRDAVITVLAVVILSATCLTAEETETWVPQVPEGMPDRWDWIQLTSLEWLKGEFIGLYDDTLEFESDELDTLSLDWEDVKRVRTARLMDLRLVGRAEVKGRVMIDGDVVTVLLPDGSERTLTRAEVVSMTVGSPKEIDHWKMKISVGGTSRTGNTNVTEASASATFVRRGAINRLIFDALGNYNITEGELITSNTRASATWDRFVNEKIFWKPVFAEYFRDPFQNIGSRITFGVGVGYHVIDAKKTEWDISGGPAYQQTRFDDVVVGEPEKEDTPALVIGSTTEMELAKWLDFNTQYRLQATNEASGSYNHHLVITFEFEVTKLLDLDIEGVWDRIKDPRENSDGTVPEQDDYRLMVMFGFDF